MNSLETAFYMGIGLALKGKEKIEEAARKFAEDSKMNSEEGKRFMEDMISSAESSKEEFTKKIDETVRNTLSKMGFATKSEVEELKAHITMLEAQLRKS